MQQSGKGAGDGKAPNLSDEQADQFAASFTPAWDADEGLGDDTNGAAKAVVVEPPPGAPGTLHKQTLMGQAPPVEEVRPIVPSSEAIDAENILESNAAPLPPIVAKAAPAAAMKTQVMQGAPGPVAAQPKAQSKPPPAAAVRSAQPQPQPRRAAAAVAADPFKRPDDDDDVIPKKSSKTYLFVIAGLAIAAGVGFVVKFSMSEDPPKAATTVQAVGPAIATADIPPPPPKVEAPAAPVAAATTAAAAARTADPLPAPLAAPATPSRSTPVVEPVAHAARQPRTPAAQPAAASPPLPAAPKTQPKTANTGIVRDNPF